MYINIIIRIVSKTLIRHKILKILAKEYIQNEEKVDATFQGVPFDELCRILHNNYKNLRLDISVLFENKEIDFYENQNSKGLIINEKGLSSLSEKKYRKIYSKKVVDSLKNFVHIFIPIISVLIAYLALTSRIDTINSETDSRIFDSEHKIKEMEKKLKDLRKLQYNLNQKHQNIDTLKN